VFFPGKFQPPHIGHVITISKLLKKYEVIIGISPDSPRVMTQKDVVKTFKKIFGDRVDYFIFSKILTNMTKGDVACLPKFDILISAGNDAVLSWGKKMGLKTKNIPRAKCIGASGSELRRLMNERKGSR